MEKISIGTAALIVVLGMAVVFFGLILLMLRHQERRHDHPAAKNAAKARSAAAPRPPLPHRL